MIAEHRSLASATERLADVRIADVAKAQAQEIAVLFAMHVAKENDILLPALVADEDVDLAQLLIQMHRLTEAGRDEILLTEDAAASDPEAVVLSLLLEAANDLSHAGHADRACRLTASAWAALRMPRPDLAVRVTAALHRLARTVAAEPITLGLSSNGQLSATDPVLDVRQLAPAQRHQSIFASYQTLPPGQVSCSSTTTTPNHSATSSKPNMPASSPGPPLRLVRRCGGCGSGGVRPPQECRVK